MRSVKQFMHDCSANTAMVTALALIPLSVVLGAGIDLRRAQNIENEIQNASDSAVLAASRELFKGATEAQAIAKAKEVFAQNASSLGVESNCDEFVATVDLTLREVSGIANCTLPLTFASIMGRNSTPVKVEAGSAFGGVEVELALMLDASGSMSGSKLTDLQQASRILIDTLIPVSDTGDVRISLVPYATSLNAGVYGDVVTGITDLYAHTVSNLGADHNSLVAALANGGASESFDLYDATAGSGLTNLPSDFFACASIDTHVDTYICQTPGGDGVGNDNCIGTSWTWMNTASLSPSDYPARACTSLAYQDDDDGDDDDDDDDGGSSTPYCPSSNLSMIEMTDCIDGSGSASQVATDWQSLDWGAASLAYADYDFSVLGSYHAANVGVVSCVTEREGDQRFTNASPIPAVVGAKSSSCPRAAVEPLTHNKTILNDAIDDMTANGWTAGQIGIAWSWYTLSDTWSPVWPFNRRAKPADPVNLRKIAVLMTDGSFNTHYATGQGNSVVQSRALCDAMKADGIEIYSVAFDAPSSGEAILSYCATSSNHFFTADNGAELQAAYAEIAMEVSQIRLTK